MIPGKVPSAFGKLNDPNVLPGTRHARGATEVVPVVQGSKFLTYERDDAASSVSGVTSVLKAYDASGTLIGYIPIYTSYGTGV